MLSFRHTKQTTKNVADTTFKDKGSNRHTPDQIQLYRQKKDIHGRCCSVFIVYVPKNIKYINSQTPGILHALHEIADAI